MNARRRNRLASIHAHRACVNACALLLAFSAQLIHAQTAAASQGTPAAASTGITAQQAVANAPPAASRQTFLLPPETVSPRHARQAEDAYLAGAKSLTDDKLPEAERHFLRAVQLNPGKTEYALALAVVRQQQVTELVQASVRERAAGHIDRAAALLQQARDMDPRNPLVLEHLPLPAEALAAAVGEPAGVVGVRGAPPLAGAIQLQPAPGKRDIHNQGAAAALLQSVYAAWGLKTVIGPDVTGRPSAFDLTAVDFPTATRAALDVARAFAVPLDAHTVMLYHDDTENREAHQPLLEETLYVPGQTPEQLTDYGNLIRNVFNPRVATVSAAGEKITLRGSENQLNAINATLSGLIDGGADVLFDLNIYEVSKTHTRDIGASLPSSAGVFSIAAEAQSLVSANQSVLNQAIASGVLQLTGTPLNQLIQELGFLIAAGLVNAPQYANFLGSFGKGLTLAGLFLGSSSSFNLLLNSSDARTLDAVQLRLGDRAEGTFRTGTRYPIVTSTYSSGVSSSLASSLSGLNVNGTSVASLLSQYLGTSSVTIPQIQYEDLGLTLKITPTVHKSNAVTLKLELKLEALAGGTVNSIPILNNRSLTSEVTVPAGQSALLASEISSSELRSLQGLPFLSELPGFTGTAQNVEHDTDELLITLTPHLVRRGSLQIASRRILVEKLEAAPAF